ncbi:hypothetical protein BB934_45500 (plasmid) [Microvirga ossetica]|uniref:Uncharacterized protein n=1 Tax=Microvirga ossetica TaxID=1882682 RepID=A0A1B2EZY3_9HYPH|nr:hypothetical protein [Microvirga ossetica]ANY85478.1 hypothetical protein BB934_45500 [Microvirga ossetica]
MSRIEFSAEEIRAAAEDAILDYCDSLHDDEYVPSKGEIKRWHGWKNVLGMTQGDSDLRRVANSVLSEKIH